MKHHGCPAVTEIFGTMLMLLIAVSLFSVIYVSVFLLFGMPTTPAANIIGTIDERSNEVYDIVLEHRGGQILNNASTKIILTLGGLQTTYQLSDILIDTNNNKIWNLGERAVITEENISGVQVELSVIDTVSNAMITQNMIQQGDRMLTPQIHTNHATEVSDTQVTLPLTYEFRQFTGTVSFQYRELGNTTWIPTTPSGALTGSGSYSETITGLQKNNWYEFQALLTYDYGTVHGDILSFVTSTLSLNTSIQWTYPYTVAVSTPVQINASGESGLDNVTLYYRYAPVNNSWSQGTNWTIWDHAGNPDTTYLDQWKWLFDFPNGSGYYEFYSMGQFIYQKEAFSGEADARCHVVYQSMLHTSVDEITPSTITDATYLLTVTSTGVSPDNVSVYYRQGTPLENWYNTSYGFRRLILVNHSRVSENLFNFPILLNITNASFAEHCQADGSDICFVNYANNITVYPHDIEYYDANTGSYVVWVNMSTVSSFADSALWMYYGNTTSTIQQNSSPVWNNGFLTVMHLNETGGAGTLFQDSTKYQHGGILDETQGDAQTGVLGKIGPAVQFDGSGSEIVDADATYINGLTEFTLSAWVKSDQTNTDSGFVIGRDPDGKDRYLDIRYDKKGALSKKSNLIKAGIQVNGNEEQLESSENTQTTEWQYLVFTWKSGEALKLYINGQQDTPTYVDNPTGSLDGIEKFIIGKGPKDTGAKGWQGKVDEVQLSEVQRSAGWIATSYQNQMYPNQFIDVYAEEAYYGSSTTSWQMFQTPENMPPWEWLFDFPLGDGYYEFYSIGQKQGYLIELPPASPDATCVKN